MTHRLLLLIGASSLFAACSAQCSTTDHPNCASWAKNGFCTNPGYTKAYIQTYCPKTCTNSGCGTTCPANSTLVSQAVAGTRCAVGTKLVGTVCCIYGKDVIGPAIGILCPTGNVLVMIPGGAAEGECAHP